MDYLIGGSVGALAHGAPDVSPADLDVIPATDPANLERLGAALDAIGATMGPEYGEWRTVESGEREWLQDGRLRPARPLDPGDATTFDHWVHVPGRASRRRSARRRNVRGAAASRGAAPRGRRGPLGRLSDRPSRRHDRATKAEGRPSGASSPIACRRRDGHLPGSASSGFERIGSTRWLRSSATASDSRSLARRPAPPGSGSARTQSSTSTPIPIRTTPSSPTGPVVGLRVADLEATRARLEASGLELLDRGRAHGERGVVPRPRARRHA